MRQARLTLMASGAVALAAGALGFVARQDRTSDGLDRMCRAAVAGDVEQVRILTGLSRNRAELARLLGCCGAWVTKVLGVRPILGAICAPGPWLADPPQSVLPVLNTRTNAILVPSGDQVGQ